MSGQKFSLANLGGTNLCIDKSKRQALYVIYTSIGDLYEQKSNVIASLHYFGNFRVSSLHSRLYSLTVTSGTVDLRTKLTVGVLQ